MAQAESGHPSTGLKEHRALGRLARTSVMWAYVRTAVIGMVGVPATIVLARLLTPADFGIAAAATFFGQFAGRLSSGGLGVALIRVKELREDHISSVFVINLVLSLICTLALIVGAPFIGAFYHAPEVGWVLPVVAINFLLGALSTIQQALLSRDLRYREMATIGSLDTSVAAVTAVVFAVLGFQYWSLVLGDVCGALVKWVMGVWFVGWHLRLRFVPAAARELGSFAMGSYTRRILEHFTLNVDNMVIGRLLGVTPLGFYDKGFSVVKKVFNKMTVVGPSVSFRIFAIIQDDPARFKRAYRKVIMTVTLLGYLVFGALAAIAPKLIVVAFGEQWRPAIVPLQILCLSFSLKLLNQYATAAAQAMGWVWPLVWRQAVQILFIIVGVYVAIPWGINGAAVAILVASIGMFFMTQAMMRGATGLGWADVLEPQVPALVSTLVLVSILWSVDAFLTAKAANDAVVLIAQLGAAGAFMLAFAWWCPFGEARMLMHEVVSDLSPRLARLMWKDVAIAQTERSARRARRAARLPPESDSPGQVVP